jgi:hypothetical protein
MKTRTIRTNFVASLMLKVPENISDERLAELLRECTVYDWPRGKDNDLTRAKVQLLDVFIGACEPEDLEEIHG